MVDTFRRSGLASCTSLGKSFWSKIVLVQILWYSKSLSMTQCVSLFIPSPIRQDKQLLGIWGVQLFLGELKPVRMVSADENLKKCSTKYFFYCLFFSLLWKDTSRLYKGHSKIIYLMCQCNIGIIFFSMFFIQKYKKIWII